ncbi:3-carboxy-cis,cis-muconate cycloisomerase [Streptomyces chattanoogensis]|uniref:3-carboxy-cis,cis-muconate cycloisomerase n=1 Tax=Streptomyces chattanoogensis TaxID=66876 RepID=A0A0N0XWW6_9ACTN|nr:3-carboxy-cis,cis-muconate cycloisomerase [Streptomyces chattanoogensis]
MPGAAATPVTGTATGTASAAPYGDADLGLLAPSWSGSAVAALTGDAAYLRAMLDAEAALTRAQAALGLAPGTAAAAVTAAAHGQDPRDLALRARAAGNPVVPLVTGLTAAVADRDPDAAPYVHRGATSQDILDTATMLVAARALDTVRADLARTADALRRTAAGHRDTPMAGRTLTQHAVPTTFGLKAAGWRALVLDAHDRLTAVRTALPVQLGGAAGTLAAFHAHAEADGHRPAPDLGTRLLAAYAAETGLAEPALPWHTLRTPVADLAGALAFTAGALGKMAADVLTLSRTETGELAEGSGGGSSAMPHKANPVRATLIAAAARQVPAHAAVLYGSLAAEDERPAGAWHAEWQPLRAALRLVGGAARDAADLAAGLRIRPHRMRRNLAATRGLVVTERLAAALAPLMGRAAARRTLDAAARRTAEEGIELSEALGPVPLPEARLRQLLDPEGYSGSAGALVDRALARRPERHPQEPTP